MDVLHQSAASQRTWRCTLDAHQSNQEHEYQRGEFCTRCVSSKRFPVTDTVILLVEDLDIVKFSLRLRQVFLRLRPRPNTKSDDLVEVVGHPPRLPCHRVDESYLRKCTHALVSATTACVPRIIPRLYEASCFQSAEEVCLQDGGSHSASSIQSQLSCSRTSIV